MSESPLAASGPKRHIGSLSRQSDFRRIYAQGRRQRSRLLTLITLATEETPDTVRVAFVVSRKVSKLATRRNRLRRQLREAFRSLLPADVRGFDVIVIVHPTAADADYWQLRGSLVETMMRSALGQNGLVGQPARER